MKHVCRRQELIRIGQVCVFAFLRFVHSMNGFAFNNIVVSTVVAFVVLVYLSGIFCYVLEKCGCGEICEQDSSTNSEFERTDSTEVVGVFSVSKVTVEVDSDPEMIQMKAQGESGAR